MTLKEHLTNLSLGLYDSLPDDRKPLIETKVPVTFSSGVNPQIMVVGRDPDKIEVDTGIPLVGPSGMILRSAIAFAGVGEYTYCTNIVPFKPIGNSFPPDVVKHFRSFLEYQIKLIKPKVILTMGDSALEWFQPNPFRSNLCERMNYGKAIGPNICGMNIPIIPVYDPSYFYKAGVRHTMIVKDMSAIKLSGEIKEQFNNWFMEPIMRLSQHIERE